MPSEGFIIFVTKFIERSEKNTLKASRTSLHFLMPYCAIARQKAYIKHKGLCLALKVAKSYLELP